MKDFKLTLVVSGTDAHLEGGQKAVFAAMRNSRFEPLTGMPVVVGQVGLFCGLPLVVKP